MNIARQSLWASVVLLSLLAPVRGEEGAAAAHSPFSIECTATQKGTTYAIQITITSIANGIKTIQSSPRIAINDGCRGEIMIGTEFTIAQQPDGSVKISQPPVDAQVIESTKVTLTGVATATQPATRIEADNLTLSMTQPAKKIEKVLFTGIQITLVKPTSANEIVYFATALEKNAVTWAEGGSVKISPEKAP